ncbi:MAG: helix-turn-helix transcriptional regulator [Acidobacteriota bacterium]|jgi:DNA-binding PadR family transcriptional regulator
MTKGGALPRTTLQIMLALTQGPLHGYGIKLDVEGRTDGAVKLGSGTLYEAIQRLLDNGWIVEVEQPEGYDASGGPARRFYDLTDEGRQALRNEVESMQEIVEFARVHFFARR